MKIKIVFKYSLIVSVTQKINLMWSRVVEVVLVILAGEQDHGAKYVCLMNFMKLAIMLLQCSRTCQTGRQRRKVECVQANVVVPDKHCDNDSRPVSLRVCNVFLCIRKSITCDV